MDFFTYVATQLSQLTFYAQQHFLLVGIAVGIAALIALAAGTLLHTNRLTPDTWSKPVRMGGREGLLIASSAALTIPSLALFGMLQPILGLGATPSLVALTLYATYPILRNVVAGLSSVDDAVLESARGMGMGPVRRMLTIQLPLAWPVILSGIRVAVLIIIGIAVVAGAINGPGFGSSLLLGLQRLGSVNSFNQVLAATLGCLVVAAVYEIVFWLVQRFTTPRGIRV
ncbi:MULTISPECIES: ABC transporter permease [Pseudonocardia]|uniref:Choline transport system permease protein OpuBB n=2 Tax=Pseudonocardia TaxID=1847 RepID=A0A1Y2MZZ8_PSEAH|nr:MULTISPECIES: ABC transporter permease [Pseudonocardia]OSY40427.1 Choline transport system permease protein OpuBB [Pseudonocardia autotrophica]TDN72244.1 osmoprotectant transport system permease protein [Pseudonocardia autotrophica]BBG02954.1 ABC transporter permease [Pseudonocardia autotrophica]GEC25145.1 ABC transporter permease [Pseudonocardia saturnea]